MKYLNDKHICPVCQQIKPPELSNNRRQHCKNCRKQKKRQEYHQNKEYHHQNDSLRWRKSKEAYLKAIEDGLTKTCCICNETKTYDLFFPRQKPCRECCHVRDRKQYDLNKKEIRERKKSQYYSNYERTQFLIKRKRARYMQDPQFVIAWAVFFQSLLDNLI